jgi:hypothetical protein
MGTCCVMRLKKILFWENIKSQQILIALHKVSILLSCAWLTEGGVLIGKCIYWTDTARNYMNNNSSRIYTVYTSLRNTMSLSSLLYVHQSFGIGFQRRTSPLPLDTRTVPVPEPKQFSSMQLGHLSTCSDSICPAVFPRASLGSSIQVERNIYMPLNWFILQSEHVLNSSSITFIYFDKYGVRFQVFQLIFISFIGNGIAQSI